MDLDLGKALHDAANRGTGHRPSIDAAPVVQRIRRRRAVRHAVEGTVGVAAAGAVAVGAVQVTTLRDAIRAPGPAASASPDPTGGPTPAPSPSTSPLDALAAVRAGGPFGCGLPAPDVVDPDGDADLRLTPSVTVGDPGPGVAGGAAEPVSVPSGAELTVEARLVNGTGRDVRATAAGAVEVWFVEDGTGVVGRLRSGSALTVPAEYALGAGEEIAATSAVGTPVTCGATGQQDDVPLPPARYDVYVVQTLELDGGSVRLTGAPVPVLIDARGSGTGGGTDDGTGDEHPDLDELAISPTGVGPLTVGLPPEGNPGAAMIAWDPVRCEDAGSGDPGRWVASGYAQDTVDGQPRDAFYVEADDQAVRRIDVLGPSVRTADGLGVGTPLADLRQAYPGLEGPFAGSVSQVWWLTGETGTLVFETQGDADGLQPVGTPERVILMRVLAGGIDPRFAAANSGDLAGACG